MMYNEFNRLSRESINLLHLSFAFFKTPTVTVDFTWFSLAVYHLTRILVGNFRSRDYCIHS